MQTRSQTKYTQAGIYSVDIDFDDASQAWKSNKVSKGNGTYGYRCMAMKRDGCQCTQIVYGQKDYCSRHCKK
jgi:hypothetical protein